MPSVPTLLIDTDLFADVDDVGALAVAHAYARRGACRIAAIALDTPSRHGVPAVRAINAFYDADVPVGAFREQDDSISTPDYARLLATRFPHADGPAPESVELLRTTLEDAAPHSVTVVSLGFLHNLAALAAAHADLVADRVRATVVMGGMFPAGAEFNLVQHPGPSIAFVRDWPVPVTFLGWEVGDPVITGRFLDATTDTDNPVAAAYLAFSGAGAGRMSWDLQTVDLAVRGAAAPYRLSAPGELRLDAAAHGVWESRPDGRHRYAIPTRSPAEIAAELDDVLAASFEEELSA